MPKRLFPCTTCHCHVKEGDATCPFCGATVQATREPEAPVGHLSRIAMVAMSAAVATASVATAGCTDGGGQSAPPVTTVGDAYGVPPMRDAGDSAPPYTAGDAYGVPPIDAGDASFSAMYGAPPMPDRDAGDGAPPSMAGDAYGVPPLDAGNRD